MNECLQLLIKELRHLQHNLNEEFRTDKFIHNKLITACQDISACQYACFKSSDSLTDLINDLQSSITTFNKSHPHQAENYQSEAYYTDRRYRNQYEKRPRSRLQQRYSDRSPDDSDQPRTPYDRGKDNSDRTISDRAMVSYKQRCFICNKVGCWSTNHILKERDASKRQLKKRFNESFKRSNYQSEKDWDKQMSQYMIDYIYIHESIDLDAENLVDEMKAFAVEIDATNYQDFEGIVFPKLAVVIKQNSKLSVNQNFYYEAG